MPSLTFLGAAGTVTGSKHLLDAAGVTAPRRLRAVPGAEGPPRAQLAAAARSPPPTFDAVVLTHAHLDHCGYLPRLVADGFRGRVFCTPGTQDLCSLVLPDSAHIQEEDARDANRQGYSKHHPALPLYTTDDAARALTQLQPVGLRPCRPGRARHRASSSSTAGHLLGSAYARITCRRKNDPLWRRPRPLRPSRAARSVAGRRRGRPARSNRPTAIACTNPTTTARGWPAIVNDDGRTRRQADHPVVRDRARRGSALLAEAARRRRAASRCCRFTSTARWRRARCSSTRTGPTSSTPT